MRWVRTRVLPEPAPASTSSGPSPCTTASRWGGVEAGQQPLDAIGAELGRSGLGRSVSVREGVALGAAGSPVENSRGGGGARSPKFTSRASSPSRDRHLSHRRTSGRCERVRRLVLGPAAAVKRGEPLLDLGDPRRERLDRLGDRVGQVDPVGVRALDPLALDLDRWPGLPITVEPGGTSSTTTVLAPTLAPSPTAIGPSSLAPEPTVTSSPRVGWRLPRWKPVPPSVTPW